MYKLYNEFITDLKNNLYLVVMPLSRFIFYEPFEIGPFKFFPSKSVDISALRPITNKNVELYDASTIQLDGQELREVATSLTGFCVETLHENPVVAFTINLKWDEFLCSNHKNDLALLKKISSQAEHAIDIIRFEFCRLDLPDTLPGLVGT